MHRCGYVLVSVRGIRRQLSARMELGQKLMPFRLSLFVFRDVGQVLRSLRTNTLRTEPQVRQVSIRESHEE